MYICTAAPWRRICAVSLPILLSLVARPSPAELLVLFDFDDALGAFENAPEWAPPQLTVGSWTDVDSTLGDFAGNPGRAVAARSFDDSNTLQFTLALEPGFVLALDGYAFDQRVSSQGPASWALVVGPATIASGPTSLEFGNVAGPIALAGLTGAVTVGITGTDAASGTGTLRIDNFMLSGRIAPVPLPSALLLLGSAGVLLGTVGCRRV